jgi:energy-converting hydrogenase Eha subunit F
MAKSAVKTASGVQTTNQPRTKVVGATIGSAVGGILVWALNKYANAGIDESVSIMIVTVVTFALGWIVPPGKDETTIP